MEVIRKLSLPARLEHLPSLVEAVASAATASGLSRTKALRMELAADEAVINVIRYAYGDGQGEVEIAVGRDGPFFVVEIADRGASFNPLSAKVPDLEAGIEERKIGGLGIHLIKTLVDGVGYRREAGRNVLTLSLSTTTEEKAEESWRSAPEKNGT